MIGISLIVCGILLFAALQFFAIPGLILYVIAGILALREKRGGTHSIDVTQNK